ncbi:MAG: hypothetical protein H6732_09620 [Alphaproteobacteria bacterium]|nr:hypothetical protein [Alphaproteobacteria bacterium]
MRAVKLVGWVLVGGLAAAGWLVLETLGTVPEPDPVAQGETAAPPAALDETVVQELTRAVQE